MNTRVFRFMAGAAISCLISVNAYASDANVEYIQLSSSMNQPAVQETNVAAFDRVNGQSNLTSAHHKIIVKVDGVYFLMVAAQVGNVKKDATGKGELDLWLIKNGQPIENSNSRRTINQGDTSVLVSQTLLSLKAGDSVSIGYSATNPDIGIIAIPAPNKEPSISSITLSMNKI